MNKLLQNTYSSIVTLTNYRFSDLLAVGLIIFIFNFSLNQIGRSQAPITSDGIGYYDYLPSLFIHSDFIRLNKPKSSNVESYKRLDSQIHYNDYKSEFKVNKYTVGTALLEFPFFYLAKVFYGDKDSDGYEKPFQKAIEIANHFYLALGLLLFIRLLLLYNVNRLTAFFLAAVIVFGTNVFHYSSTDAGYSHVFSFFAISSFCYFSKIYFTKSTKTSLIIVLGLLGLIFIIRQINILVLFVLPFLAGSSSKLFESIKGVFIHYKSLLIGSTLAICFIGLQLISWYLQTGDWIVYSYGEEGFNFTSPEIINVLFSYKRGLIIYTPIVILSFLGVLHMTINKMYYKAFTWTLFFSIILYFISSWWVWDYGCGLGHRTFIDYYSIIFIPAGVFLNNLNRQLKLILSVIIIFLSYLNIVQSYQYRVYTMDWCEMNETKYWDIFLNVRNNIKGYVWKSTENLAPFDTLGHYQFKYVNAYENPIIIDRELKLLDEDKLKYIDISFFNNFSSSNESHFYLELKSEDSILYSHRRSLIHFAHDFNKYHYGNFQFRVNLPDSAKNINFLLSLITSNKDDGIINNVNVYFIGESYNKNRISDIVAKIKTDSVWFNTVKADADKRQVSINEALIDHAKWMIANNPDYKPF